MQYAPTRIRAKIVWFHISAPEYTQNPPGFIPKPSARDIWGRMLLRPTPVRTKPARFHISAHGYPKNAPDFTLPNKDTPKTHPILHPSRRRGTFRGVCFCAPTRVCAKPARFHIPAHVPTKKPPGFRRNPLSQDIWGRMLLRPTRIHEKFARFHISTPEYAKNVPGFTFPNKDSPKTSPILGANPCRRTFRGVCNTSLHGYVQNSSGFIFPHTNTPKSRPVLGLNLRQGLFRGVCNTPLHGYVQNLTGFGLKPSARGFSGRMQYAPTRVHRKMGGFHIPARVPTKNVPDFTLPNKDAPNTHPVLYPNRRRRTFGGVCFCALHGYVQNLTGFTFPHPDTPKTHPVLDPNPSSRDISGRMLLRPYTGTCKIWRVLGANPCRGTFSGRMQYAPTRVREKPVLFYTQTFVEAISGAYAIRHYTGTHKIWRVSYFRTQIRPKPARF